MKTRLLLTTLLVAAMSLQVQGASFTVKTNARFVRGATMAFGRLSVSGSTSQIKERGFCYSTTSPEPTIDDMRTTKTLTNNGVIYWLQDLEPATKYYMRAYAISKTDEAVYGDVIKFYTVPKGNITWNFHNRGDAATEKRIKDAVDGACYYFNNMTSVVKTFDVTYSPGTPTADCNYTAQPWMNVGANTSYQRTGTIMHEMEHGLGVIPYSTQWAGSILRSGNGTGDWLGDRATESLRFWDNDGSARLHGDTQHMWPYGINGAHEDNGSEVTYLANAMLCQALGEDGLEHTDNHFADPYYAFDQEDDVKYYLKNEDTERGFYTSYLVADADGTLSWKEIATAELGNNDEAAWYLTFTPSNQFYQLRNAATGQYLYMSGSTVKTIDKTSAATDFHVMKGRVNANGTTMRGYWLLHHAARNPRALAAGKDGKVTTETFNLANTATTQRWLIVTSDQPGTIDEAAMKAFRKQINDVVTRLKKFMAVPHSEDGEQVDEAATQALAEIEAGLESATSVAELMALLEKAQEAEANFLANVTPTDTENPFDMTYLIKNAGMAATDGWSEAFAINYSCGEFYEKTFDLNQTLTGLPAGTYVLKAQAFQRPGSSTEAYNYFKNNQQSKITTFLYAGSKSVRVKSICDAMQTTKLGVGTEVAVGSNPTYYIPNDMQSTANYFKKGYYENSVTSTVGDNGSLKVGIRCSSSGSKYWSIFDNFRLYYYGSMPADEVTGIETIGHSQATGDQSDGSLYNLQGQRVIAPRHGGIYIKNGKKVVIK